MARKKHKPFLNYPIPEQGPEIAYHPSQEQNPVLRGWPLVLASHLITRSSAVAGLVWSNAKFGTVRDIPGLGRYPPRLDPVVVPLSPSGGGGGGGGGGHDDEHDHEHDQGAAATLKTLLTPDLYERQPAHLPGRFHSAADYHEAYKSGETSPVDVAEALFSLFSSEHGHGLAVAISVDRAKVMAAARRSAARYAAGESLGLLDGVPVGVKEDLDVEGYVSYNGLSPAAFGASASATTATATGPAPAKKTISPVSRLEAAGCLVLCKTAMHELGTDTSGCNPRCGTPINWFAPGKYYPGGSSSGSGSALGAGLLVIAVGTDAGGSLRIPAAYNGVFALKPTLHRTMVMRSAICVVGPMAATAGDLAAAYRVMSEPCLSPASSSSSPSSWTEDVQGSFAPPSSALHLLPPRLSSSSSSSSSSQTKKKNKNGEKGRRKILGICRPWVDAASPVITKAFYRAVRYFENKLGYEVVDISIPYLAQGQYAHSAWALTEAADLQRSLVVDSAAAAAAAAAAVTTATTKNGESSSSSPPSSSSSSSSSSSFSSSSSSAAAAAAVDAAAKAKAADPMGLGPVNHCNRLLLSIGTVTPGTDMIKYAQLRELLMRHLAFLFRKYQDEDEEYEQDKDEEEDERGGKNDFFILTPTSPDKGWAVHPGDAAYGFSDANMTIRQMMYIWLANSTGCPAASAPMGYYCHNDDDDDDGGGDGDEKTKLPLGFMAMGEWGGEEALMRWAKDAETYINDVSGGSSSGGKDEDEVMMGCGGRLRPEEPGWVDVLRDARRSVGGRE